MPEAVQFGRETNHYIAPRLRRYIGIFIEPVIEQGLELALGEGHARVIGRKAQRLGGEAALRERRIKVLLRLLGRARDEAHDIADRDIPPGKGEQGQNMP